MKMIKTKMTGTKMIKKNTLNWLFIFIFFIALTGCASTEKKSKTADRYKEWRVLAEKSKGNTPSSRKYDLNTKKDKQLPVQKKEMEQQPKSDRNTSTAIERELPKIPVSLKMYEVSVPVLLRTLARVANMNILINETVTGNANLNINNLAWDKAFIGLLNTYSLTYKWSGNVLRVITIEDLKKETSLMKAQQTFEKTKKNHAIEMLAIQKEEEKLDPLTTKIIKIDYADIAPLRDNLEKYLLAGKNTSTSTQKDENTGGSSLQNAGVRGSILMDKYTNSLIIQATASDIEKIIPIIQRLDRPSAQILIEAHIVEANSDTAKELGIQWGGLGLSTGGNNDTWVGGPLGAFEGSLTDTAAPNIGNAINLPSSATAGTSGWKGMTLGLMTQNIGNYILYAQLTALQEEGKLNILSKPSITTMDHKKAIIESGKEVPFQTVEDGETKIEFKKAVIKLEVTPHVINKEVIRLEILTHKDELDWTNKVLGNPTIITKNAETKVTLFDGQTTVIGGLNKEKILEGESGIPWLKDLPGLGVLFRSNSSSADMEELLIFITPHILKPRPKSGTKNNE